MIDKFFPINYWDIIRIVQFHFLSHYFDTDSLHFRHDYCLQKCLTTLDLTSLGVGSCVGTGMYLVAGMVARSVAGPGVVISFIIAAIASIFSGEYHNFSQCRRRKRIMLSCRCCHSLNTKWQSENAVAMSQVAVDLRSKNAFAFISNLYRLILE